MKAVVRQLTMQLTVEKPNGDLTTITSGPINMDLKESGILVDGFERPEAQYVAEKYAEATLKEPEAESLTLKKITAQFSMHRLNGGPLNERGDSKIHRHMTWEV